MPVSYPYLYYDLAHINLFINNYLIFLELICILGLFSNNFYMAKTLISAVSGVSFYQENLLNLNIGDKIDIIPQPENPYDSAAKAVYYNGLQLGYIPKTLAQRVHGFNLKGEIVYILRGELTGLRIRIFLEEPISSTLVESKPVSPVLDILVREKKTERVLGFLVEKNEKIALIKSKNKIIRRKIENLEFTSEPLYI